MRVLVVGAGIGGLSAAIALRRSGHDVVVAEEAPGRAAEGFSITIPSNCARALHDLGALDSLRPMSTVLTRFEYSWQDDVFISESLDAGCGP